MAAEAAVSNAIGTRTYLRLMKHGLFVLHSDALGFVTPPLAGSVVIGEIAAACGGRVCVQPVIPFEIRLTHEDGARTLPVSDDRHW